MLQIAHMLKTRVLIGWMQHSPMREIHVPNKYVCLRYVRNIFHERNYLGNGGSRPNLPSNSVLNYRQSRPFQEPSARHGHLLRTFTGAYPSTIIKFSFQLFLTHLPLSLSLFPSNHLSVPVTPPSLASLPFVSASNSLRRHFYLSGPPLSPLSCRNRMRPPVAWPWRISAFLCVMFAASVPSGATVASHASPTPVLPFLSVLT